MKVVLLAGSLIHFGSGSNNYSYVAEKIYTVPTSTWSTRFSGDRIYTDGIFVTSILWFRYWMFGLSYS